MPIAPRSRRHTYVPHSQRKPARTPIRQKLRQWFPKPLPSGPINWKPAGRIAHWLLRMAIATALALAIIAVLAIIIYLLAVR